MADLKGKVTLDNIIAQAMKITGVKVNRAEFLRAQFASQGILVTQIVGEGPVACDYSEIELDEVASALILRRTSESSAMSFAAGLPGGLALAATIPADTLQFFAMSLRMAQELAYLYGAKDFWTCEGEEGKMVRFLLICSLGAMYGIEGAAAGTRLLSSYLAMRATGGIPTRATTVAFWGPVTKRISNELAVRLSTDTASKGIAKIIPVVGGFFSGGMTFFAMRPMGRKLSKALSETSFYYSDSFAMKDYITLEDMVGAAEAEMMDDEAPDTESWGSIIPGGAKPKEDAGKADTGSNGAQERKSESTDDAEDGSIPISVNGVMPGTEAVSAEASEESGEIPIGVASPADATAEAPVQQASENTAPAMTTDEVFALIEKLAALRDKGAITQEDFDAKKTELLARI